MTVGRLFGGTIALLVVTLVHLVLTLTVTPRAGTALVSAVIAAWTYVAAVMYLPRMRPTSETPLSPLNWMLLVFGWQLIVQPIVVAILGPSQGALPFLPRREYQELALLAMTAAFVSFAWGFGGRADEGAEPPRPEMLGGHGLYRLGFMFVMIGVVGLALRFDGWDEMTRYYLEPWRAILDAGRVEQAPVSRALSNVTRPFLPAGAILLWAMMAREGRQLAVASTIAVVVILAVGSTFNFNRAAMVVPLVAFLGAWGRFTGRLTWRKLTLAGFAVAAPAWTIGHLRARPTATMEPGRILSTAASDFGTEVQIYGGAPQFAGFLLEQVDEEAYRGGPRMLVNSLLYSIPRLGAPFREESGVAVYNSLIYGSASGVRDQVVPFVAETAVAGGPLLLLLAFFGIGRATRWLDRRFRQGANAFDAWAAQYGAIWLSFLLVGSLAAVVQVVVYFAWPFVGYVGARQVIRAARNR